MLRWQGRNGRPNTVVDPDDVDGPRQDAVVPDAKVPARGLLWALAPARRSQPRTPLAFRTTPGALILYPPIKKNGFLII
jgi:hypothetical protein